MRYNPTENINLRLSYGSGFRAPQAFDEDLHITIASGERNVIVLADDLREERSNSFSLSADIYQNFGSVMTNFLIEGFYTELNNVFDLRKKSEQDEFSNVVWERYNASGARVYGATLEGRIAFTPVCNCRRDGPTRRANIRKPWNGAKRQRLRNVCSARRISTVT